MRIFNLTLSLSELTVPRGKTQVKARHRSRRLESDPGAVDDPNFLCALLCSACSTTCCCIAVLTVESNYDFLRPICRHRLCKYGLGISRQTGFNLKFPSPRWIACQGYELHPPSLRFCLVTYKLLGELSAKTMSFPCPASFV